MKWLESPQDEAEKLLRDSLDLAAQQTGDEISHRRVWAKVADSLLEPERRISGRLVLATASATVAVLAVVGLVVYPYVGSKRPLTAPATTKLAKAPSSEATASPSSLAAAPEPKWIAPEESERAPGNVVSTGKGERARVALGGGATADLAESSAVTWDSQHRPAIEHGSARLSVPHQPPGWRFSVTAGPYVVTVVGTKFTVEVGGRTVGVEVSEGVVEVSRGSHTTRLAAGDAWHGPLYPEESAGSEDQAASVTPPPSERPQPAPARAQVSPAPALAGKPTSLIGRSLPEAEAALRSGDTSRAIDILSRAAQGTGPAAENASYELARVTRYNLGKPRQAVALWDKYRSRFPNGLLRTEADLSIVETLSQLGDVQAALAEANAFISRHPSSERRGDVQRLAERLRAAEASSESR